MRSISFLMRRGVTLWSSNVSGDRRKNAVKKLLHWNCGIAEVKNSSPLPNIASLQAIFANFFIFSLHHPNSKNCTWINFIYCGLTKKEWLTTSRTVLIKMEARIQMASRGHSKRSTCNENLWKGTKIGSKVLIVLYNEIVSVLQGLNMRKVNKNRACIWIVCITQNCREYFHWWYCNRNGFACFVILHHSTYLQLV